MIEKKQCTRCKRWLPLTEFHKHKPSKDGRKPRCKDCRCELQKQYAQDNPEKKRESDRRYRLANPEKIKEKSRRYRMNNLELIKAKDVEYRTRNRDRLKNYFREFYIRNRHKKLDMAMQYANDNAEKVKRYQKRYRTENAEQLKEHRRQFRKRHPDRYKIYSLNYIARKHSAEGEYTEEQWQDLCSYFDGVCPCCSKETDSFEADHVVPLSWSGSTNWITNIQPLCRSCNTSKGNHHSTDYRPDYVKRWAEEQRKNDR